MDQNSFKRANKPASCTQPPWQYLIPKDQRDSTLRKIREETVLAYGESFDECPKRKTCFTKECLGRPLPFLSETAKPYLEELKKTQKVVDNEMFISNCNGCPIFKTCTSTCSQVNDYMNRDKNQEIDFVLKADLEDVSQKVQVAVSDKPKATDLQLPWDILPSRKANVIKKYLYEQKDFLAVANELDLSNQAEAKYQFYSSLTKMSEYAVMRKFIDEKGEELTEKQLLILKKVYIENNTLTDVAIYVNTSVAAITGMLNRIVDKYAIKWPVFVRKEDNKPVYNVPEILK